MRYSIKEKIKIVEIHFAIKSTAHLQKELPRRKAPTRPTIYCSFGKFKDTCSLQNHFGRSGRPTSARTKNHVEVLKRCFGGITANINKTFIAKDRCFEKFRCVHNLPRYANAPRQETTFANPTDKIRARDLPSKI